MALKVYISGMSGNKEVKKRQQRVLMILDSKNVTYKIIDITEPGKENEKEFMQSKSTSNGATVSDPEPRHPLPPQIFNEEEYCGDYDAFDLANETDALEIFLRLAPGDAIVESSAQIEIKKENGVDATENKESDKNENKQDDDGKNVSDDKENTAEIISEQGDDGENKPGKEEKEEDITKVVSEEDNAEKKSDDKENTAEVASDKGNDEDKPAKESIADVSEADNGEDKSDDKENIQEDHEDNDNKSADTKENIKEDQDESESAETPSKVNDEIIDN